MGLRATGAVHPRLEGIWTTVHPRLEGIWTTVHPRLEGIWTTGPAHSHRSFSKRRLSRRCSP